MSVASLGELGVTWDQGKATRCSYVFDGERVAVYMGSGRAQWGNVTCAAGHHARVALADGREVWRNVSDLARPKGVVRP